MDIGQDREYKSRWNNGRGNHYSLGCNVSLFLTGFSHRRWPLTGGCASSLGKWLYHWALLLGTKQLLLKNTDYIGSLNADLQLQKFLKNIWWSIVSFGEDTTTWISRKWKKNSQTCSNFIDLSKLSLAFEYPRNTHVINAIYWANIMWQMQQLTS